MDAIRAFFTSIITYVTICQHATMVHFHISAYIAQYNTECLDIKHPIRLLLLPTEFGTLNVIASSAPSLLNRNGCFNYMFSYTFDGLKHMVYDFRKTIKINNILVGDNVDNLKLSKNERKVTQFREISIWHKYFQTFAKDMVDILYPTDNDIRKDTQILNYLNKCNKHFNTPINRQGLMKIINIAYENQIRHNLQSNDTFSYTIAKIVPFIRKNNNTHLSNYSLVSSFRCTLTSKVTSLEWLLMTTNISSIISSANNSSFNKKQITKAQNRWQEFYDDLWNININIKIPTLTANTIRASTGL